MISLTKPSNLYRQNSKAGNDESEFQRSLIGNDVKNSETVYWEGARTGVNSTTVMAEIRGRYRVYKDN